MFFAFISLAFAYQPHLFQHFLQLIVTQIDVRKIFRSKRAGLRQLTAFDQGAQVLLECASQVFNRLNVITFAAEGPVKVQTASAHEPVDGDQVRLWLSAVAPWSSGLTRHREKRIAGENLIELTEVIKAHFRLRQRPEFLGAPSLPIEKRKHAITDTRSRNGPQLFLDF